MNNQVLKERFGSLVLDSFTSSKRTRSVFVHWFCVRDAATRLALSKKFGSMFVEAVEADKTLLKLLWLGVYEDVELAENHGIVITEEDRAAIEHLSKEAEKALVEVPETKPKGATTISGTIALVKEQLGLDPEAMYTVKTLASVLQVKHIAIRKAFKKLVEGVDYETAGNLPGTGSPVIYKGVRA